MPTRLLLLDPTSFRENWGIVRHDLKPKAAYQAMVSMPKLAARPAE